MQVSLEWHHTILRKTHINPLKNTNHLHDHHKKLHLNNCKMSLFPTPRYKTSHEKASGKILVASWTKPISLVSIQLPYVFITVLQSIIKSALTLHLFSHGWWINTIIRCCQTSHLGFTLGIKSWWMEVNYNHVSAELFYNAIISTNE